MKKLFVILIALALLVGVSAPTFAAGPGQATVTSYGGGVGLGTLRTVTCINSSASQTITLVPIANRNWDTAAGTFVEPSIIPGKVKILGYDVTCLGVGAAGGYVSLIDATAWTQGSGDIFAEVEATVSVPVYKIYPIGLTLQFGLVVDQAPYTSVTVYYIQNVP